MGEASQCGARGPIRPTPDGGPGASHSAPPGRRRAFVSQHWHRSPPYRRATARPFGKLRPGRSGALPHGSGARRYSYGTGSACLVREDFSAVSMMAMTRRASSGFTSSGAPSRR